MSAWGLPKALTVHGAEYPINSDYRTVLGILGSFSDPDLTDAEKWKACLDGLYADASSIPLSDLQEAAERASEFIDMREEGKAAREGGGPSGIMDWEQDAPLYIPAINRVLGMEIRAAEYLHWWTFLGAYMSIGESLFSTVISIRSKKARGEKLDKWEERFWAENRHICALKKRHSREEQARIDKFLQYLDQ